MLGFHRRAREREKNPSARKLICIARLEGESTGVVELPVEWIRDDYPYFGMDRVTTIRPHTAPSLVGEIWQREFDGAYAERGLFLLTMHPHIIGHRSRVSVLDELIRHMRSHSGVWFATHADIARYVKAQGG